MVNSERFTGFQCKKFVLISDCILSEKKDE